MDGDNAKRFGKKKYEGKRSPLEDKMTTRASAIVGDLLDCWRDCQLIGDLP